jgi:hypothetical protein
LKSDVKPAGGSAAGAAAEAKASRQQRARLVVVRLSKVRFSLG